MMTALIFYVSASAECVCLCQSGWLDMRIPVLHTCTRVPMRLPGIIRAQPHYWLDPGHGAVQPHLWQVTRFIISFTCCVSISSWRKPIMFTPI